MIIEPGKILVKTFTRKIEEELEKRNYKEIIKICNVFISIIENYEKSKQSMNNQRR